jgi:hypothetical protein
MLADADRLFGDARSQAADERGIVGRIADVRAAIEKKREVYLGRGELDGPPEPIIGFELLAIEGLPRVDLVINLSRETGAAQLSESVVPYLPPSRVHPNGAHEMLRRAGALAAVRRRTGQV